MPIIRSAQQTDLPILYEICLKTADTGGDATAKLANGRMAGDCLIAPYLHYNLKYCSVLEASDGPVGYLTGCSNTDDFENWFAGRCQTRLIKKYPRVRGHSKLESILYEKIHRPAQEPNKLSQYPAHLHISLVPEMRRCGYGKKMIYLFEQQLRHDRVCGYHLTVSSENSSAIEFYHHIGLQLLAKEATALYFGRLL